MQSTIRTFTADDAGCYLDSHRGHYISRDVVDFAEELGYIVRSLERWLLDCYEDHGHEDNYPAEIIYELCDDAIGWLNSGQGMCNVCNGRGTGDNGANGWFCKECSGTGRGDRIAGQNFPPVIPDGHVWEFNDGDFGLYAEEDLS